MALRDIPNIASWLKQFNIPDVYLAEFMLQKLRYVSLSEMDTWIQQEVLKLIEHIELKSRKKEAIALFPVYKPTIHKHNEHKELKPANDSSGRIAHALKNVERATPNHIELTPRVESMLNTRVRHIIYVDDYIGTGDRFIKSWRTMVSRRVKSWCSRGWCQIWVLSFAAHEKGIKNIVEAISPLKADHIRVNHIVDESFIAKNEDLRSLCYRYGSALDVKKANLGYGNLLSPFVFEHSCPNNAPGILWAKGSKKIGGRTIKWKPLFPDRSIPADMHEVFGRDHSQESTAEDLWLANHFRLALTYMENPQIFGDEHQQLSILAYLNSGNDLNKIRRVMVMSDAKFSTMISKLNEYGLIRENKVTRFGKDVLKRANKNNIHWRVKDDAYRNFYPATFQGFQRNV